MKISTYVMVPMLHLKGNRLDLMPLAEEFLPVLLYWWQTDPGGHRFFDQRYPFCDPKRLSQNQKLVRASSNMAFGEPHRGGYELADQVTFIVVSRDPKVAPIDTPLGVFILENINWIHRYAFTRSYIAEPYRGIKLGLEAKIVLLKFTFESLRFHKMRSDLIKINFRSSHLNENCGYVTFAVDPEHAFIDGRWRDLVMMYMMSKAWFVAKHKLDSYGRRLGTKPKHSESQNRFLAMAGMLSSIAKS